MPTIKDFEKHHSGPKKPHSAAQEKAMKNGKSSRRRPGRDPQHPEADELTPVENLKDNVTIESDRAAGTVLPSDQAAPEHHSKAWEREAAIQGVSGGSEELNKEILENNPLPHDPGPREGFQEAAGAEADGAEADGGREKLHIDFYGSELLRARVPKAFEFAEAVADDWVNDGRFEGLPVGHPLAQLGAQQVLRKAKDIEKKLDEKGVFMLARVGLEYAKSKLGRK